MTYWYSRVDVCDFAVMNICWKHLAKACTYPAIHLHLCLPLQQSQSAEPSSPRPPSAEYMCRVLNYLCETVQEQVSELLRQTHEPFSASPNANTAFTRGAKITRFYLLHLCALIRAFPQWVTQPSCMARTVLQVVSAICSLQLPPPPPPPSAEPQHIEQLQKQHEFIWSTVSSLLLPVLSNAIACFLADPWVTQVESHSQVFLDILFTPPSPRSPIPPRLASHQSNLEIGRPFALLSLFQLSDRVGVVALRLLAGAGLDSLFSSLSSCLAPLFHSAAHVIPSKGTKNDLFVSLFSGLCSFISTCVTRSTALNQPLSQDFKTQVVPTSQSEGSVVKILQQVLWKRLVDPDPLVQHLVIGIWCYLVSVSTEVLATHVIDTCFLLLKQVPNPRHNRDNGKRDLSSSSSSSSSSSISSASGSVSAEEQYQVLTRPHRVIITLLCALFPCLPGTVKAKVLSQVSFTLTPQNNNRNTGGTSLPFVVRCGLSSCLPLSEHIADSGSHVTSTFLGRITQQVFTPALARLRTLVNTITTARQTSGIYIYVIFFTFIIFLSIAVFSHSLTLSLVLVVFSVISGFLSNIQLSHGSSTIQTLTKLLDCPQLAQTVSLDATSILPSLCKTSVLLFLQTVGVFQGLLETVTSQSPAPACHWNPAAPQQPVQEQGPQKWW